MSNDKTGMIWVPGFHGALGVREDGAAVKLGTVTVTATELTNIAGTVSSGVLDERPAESSLNSVNWRMVVNQVPYTGSGVGGEDYVNEVVGLGWNMGTTIAVRGDPAKSMIWDGWEYKYNIGGKYYHERHIETVDEDGDRHRLFSLAAAHDGSDLRAEIIVHSISLVGPDGTARVNMGLSNGQFHFYSGSRIIGYANNTSWLQQLNAAANDTIELMRVNSSNQVVVDPGSNGARTGGSLGVGVAPSATAWLQAAAGTTAKAQINLPVSVAPTSPVDGDIWREDNTNSGLKIRVNGVTKTITLS